MPTAVMMEENFDKLLEQCEAQELEVSAKSRTLFFSCVIISVDFRLSVSDGLGSSVSDSWLAQVKLMLWLRSYAVFTISTLFFFTFKHC